MNLLAGVTLDDPAWGAVIVLGGMAVLLLVVWVFESGAKSYQSRPRWQDAERSDDEVDQ